MRRLWDMSWRLRIAPELAWRDLWDTQIHWLIRTLLFAVIAALVAFLVATRTGSVVPFLVLLTYPIGVILMYLGFLVANACGWRRVWNREWQIHETEEGRRLFLSLQPKPALSSVRLEVTCDVTDPAGRGFQAALVNQFDGRCYCIYPDVFDQAPPVVAGTYRVLWRWRKAGAEGTWLAADAHSITVAALAGTVDVRLRTDGNASVRDDATVSSDPDVGSGLCGACGGRLVPLSSSLPEGVEGGPNFKCPECGESYVLRGSAHWSPPDHD